MYGCKQIMLKHTNVPILVRTDQVVHDPRRLYDKVQNLPIITKWIHIHVDPQRSVWTPTSRSYCTLSPPKPPHKI